MSTSATSNNLTVCLNAGQVIDDHCDCTKICFVGDQCEIPYNLVDLPFASAILQDRSSTPAVYIAVITLLVFIGCVNNTLALVTLLRERIRMTVCGLYLLVFVTCDLILMCLFQTTVLTVARYDTMSYRLWSCNIIPYLSLTLGFTAMWLSVGISIEKVLIECLNFGLYGSRLRAILLSVGFFVLAAVANLANIFARHYILDPMGTPICTYDFLANPQWGEFNKVASYVNVIVPISVHLICSICILTTIARRKVLIQASDRSCRGYGRVWLRQLFVHRDFFIPPLCMALFVFPNSIYGNLLNLCISSSDLIKLRVHIAFVFMLHGPIIFIFMVYIYPSELYTREFQETCLYRTLCCCFYRRRMAKESNIRRQRAASSATVQHLVLNTDLF